MYNELRKYFANRFQFSNNDFELIASQFVSKKISKGEFLQHAGDLTKYAAFVEKGCLRMYVIDHKSKEHIVQFAPGTWWLNDSSSLLNQTPLNIISTQLKIRRYFFLHPPVIKSLPIIFRVI